MFTAASVADAPSCTESRLPFHYLRKQLVGMQAAFHNEIRLAGAYQFDSLRGGSLAVRHVHDFNVAEIERKLPGDRGDLALGTDKDGLDQSGLSRFDGPSQRSLVARMRYGGSNGFFPLRRGDQAVVFLMSAHSRSWVSPP